MGVGRLSAIAGLLLLIAVPLVLWWSPDDTPQPDAAATATEPAGPAPGVKVDLFAVGTARRFAAEGPLQTGEKLRLRVALDAPAHLLVGRRRAGKAELLYPRGMAGRSVAMPKAGPREIGQPFAAQAGDELVLYACERTLTWPKVRNLGELAGCTRWAQVVK